MNGTLTSPDLRPSARRAAVPSPMSDAFIARPSVLQPSTDPDQAAQQTIDLMCKYIHASARDSVVQAETRGAVASFPSLAELAGLAPKPDQERGIAEACWWWAKHNLKFVHHSDLLRAYLNAADALQLLISPDVIMHALNGSDVDARNRARQGDCAIYSPVICAMLEAAGLDWELCIAAVDRKQPEVFSHVWPRVLLSDGTRVSLDASHGPYPGWHVPAGDIFRLRVFNSNGQAVEDQGGTFEGFGNYIATGMGDVEEISSVDPNIFNQQWEQPDMTIGGGSPSFNSPSSGSGFNWGNEFGSLLNQWTQIGGRVVAPQTTYTVGRNGQVSYSTPGAAPPPVGVNSLGGGNTLLWVGGGLALVLGVMAFAGKK